jgi:hypothetical protein
VKDIALQMTQEAKGEKLHTLREYVQNYILFLMQKTGMSSSLYFVGGTALRFLYRIRRYSEDLDFSAAENWNEPDLPIFMKTIANQLEKSGYSCTINIKERYGIQKAVIGFVGLLYGASLTHHKEQKLNIHLEIDLNPPKGWVGKRTIVDLHLPVVLQHYDLASLFAGKCHALLMRAYTKGRDVYDLFWYRTKHNDLLPNFELLNNALQQTQEGYIKITPDNWLGILDQRIRSLKWKALEDDVLPFLEFQDDLLSFTQENLRMLLS